MLNSFVLCCNFCACKCACTVVVRSPRGGWGTVFPGVGKDSGGTYICTYEKIRVPAHVLNDALACAHAHARANASGRWPVPMTGRVPTPQAGPCRLRCFADDVCGIHNEQWPSVKERLWPPGPTALLQRLHRSRAEALPRRPTACRTHPQPAAPLPGDGGAAGKGQVLHLPEVGSLYEVEGRRAFGIP